MGSGARWSGAAAARRRFSRLPAVVRDELNKAVSDTTKAIRDAARSRAPVRTGALKKSITSRVDKRRAKGTVQAKARHAHLIEFGTSKMDARPFMLPAAEAERSRFIERAKDSGRRVEREMKK